jgi:hypothetical protein
LKMFLKLNSLELYQKIKIKIFEDEKVMDNKPTLENTTRLYHQTSTSNNNDEKFASNYKYIAITDGNTLSPNFFANSSCNLPNICTKIFAKKCVQ